MRKVRNMRTLRFCVNAQKIRHDPNCDFSGLVSGTAGYLKASFKFSKEWSGMVKVAEFQKYLCSETISVQIINNECAVPAEVTDGEAWKVKVIGKRGNTILPTGSCKVEQEG